jgi:hypothetical protein
LCLFPTSFRWVHRPDAQNWRKTKLRSKKRKKIRMDFFPTPPNLSKDNLAPQLWPLVSVKNFLLYLPKKPVLYRLILSLVGFASKDFGGKSKSGKRWNWWMTGPSDIAEKSRLIKPPPSARFPKPRKSLQKNT